MNDAFIVFQQFLTHDGATASLYAIPICKEKFLISRFHEENIYFPSDVQRSAPKRQMEYFYGRLVARRALEDFQLGESRIETGLSREPIWPTGITGSITHNESYAAAIALDARVHGAIGIDLETLISKEKIDGVLSTIATVSEASYLLQLKTNLSVETLVTVLFSAKESFFKAAFPLVGFFFDFDAVELCFLDPNKKTLVFRVQSTLSKFFIRGSFHKGRYECINSKMVFTFCSWPAFLIC